MKPVLILTAGFGEGHNAAARNLRDALLAASPGAKVEMADVFASAYGWFNTLSVRGYLLLINRAPDLWSVVFQWLHESAAVPSHIGLLGRAARELRRVIDRLQPAVIVSTYPGNNLLLDHLYRGKSGRPTQVTVVTDSITINAVWHAGHSDFYLVANEETAEVMRSQGVDPAKIRVTGFPVPAVFAELRQPKAPPAPGGKWRVLFMVNSGKQIAADIVRPLAAMDDVELTVTVGRDDALLARIQATAEAAGGAAQLFGWTDQMSRLMAESHVVISKAGGATVQESLAAETPMIVSQVVPGQEEGNAQLIVRAGAGVLAETPERITAAVRSAFANGGQTWTAWHAATRRLHRPDASHEIAQWIGKLTAEETDTTEV